MYSTTAPSTRQVLASAQAVLDKIVQEAAPHTISQDILAYDDELVSDDTGVTATSDELSYDDRESYAFMRMYHPRYTMTLDTRPTGAVAIELWTQIQKDVLRFVSMMTSYLSAWYTYAEVEVRAWVYTFRVHAVEHFREIQENLEQHKARVEAQVAERKSHIQKLQDTTKSIQNSIPVEREVHHHSLTATQTQMAPPDLSGQVTYEYTGTVVARNSGSTPLSTYSALVDVAPFLVYTRAFSLVMTRIIRGYAPARQTSGSARNDTLTQQQFTDITDIGTHSAISERIAPVQV